MSRLLCQLSYTAANPTQTPESGKTRARRTNIPRNTSDRHDLPGWGFGGEAPDIEGPGVAPRAGISERSRPALSAGTGHPDLEPLYGIEP